MTNFLYHRVPENMSGYVLYPLNQLKGMRPDIYAEQVRKYDGREFVMNQRVPTLDCLWNDVLHFSAVHPQEISDEMKKLGQGPLKWRKFYQIDPAIFDVDKTTVYLYRTRLLKEKMLPENWSKFRIEDLCGYSKLPEETIRYYQEQIKEGKKPLLWAWVPHILHKGEIDISNSKIITVT